MEDKTLTEIMDVTLVQAEPVVMDYETMKERLTATLRQYDDIEVTAETLKSCKDTQKEIAGLRRQLDDFRKAVKKRYQEPLQIFEDQIKSMIAMVDEVENPLKEGIKEFDNLRRAEKKEQAEKIIAELIAEYELNDKFARQIDFKKSYTNLTAKESDVRTDVDAQCMLLKQQQDNEESIKKTIVNTVEVQNKGITAKLVPEVYISLIGKLPTDEIIDRILKRGEEIRRMESEAEKKKASQESVRDSENEEKPEREEQVQKEEKTPENGNKDIYKVVYVVTGNAEQMQSVSKFLKDNSINYSVESQFIIS
jgi:hypothetical protein